VPVFLFHKEEITLTRIKTHFNTAKKELKIFIGLFGTVGSKTM
jgi:hypothetical protein